MCEKEKQVMMYLLGELEKDEENAILSHMEKCPECLKFFQELEKIDEILKKRKAIDIPEGLLNQCLDSIDREAKTIKNESKFIEWINRLIPLPRPALSWVVIVIVFCGGLGLGKLLFDPPAWMKRSLSGSMNTENNVENQLLRNYLMSVEMLFLDMSNIENPSLLGDHGWEVEMEITQEILNRTRQIKIRIPERNSDLFRLVTEIEVTLEDVLDAAQIDLAVVPVELQQNMEAYRILDRINEYVL